MGWTGADKKNVREQFRSQIRERFLREKLNDPGMH